MTTRLAKTVLVILLGFLLAWHGVFAMSARAGNLPSAAHNPNCECCKSGCGKCTTPVCCTKPAENREPFAPASLPTTSQNEWHALAASVSSWVTLPSIPVVEFPSPGVPSAPVTVIPLFQRDCCYLI
ncbi:hypothetical protein GC207_02530 [bacterium]|nr:hypothetical protein [bacterium]